jgi:hypothetical protein
MNGRRLQVLNVGTDWFVPFLELQHADVVRIAWAPPARAPDDIAAILRRLREGE